MRDSSFMVCRLLRRYRKDGNIMSETRTITMKTNFEGLIRLLADGLYSTSDIFVRELIQNGHDSIVRREALKESFYQGEISITYDSSEKSITFADNGIGMDESDIENFLSFISGDDKISIYAAFNKGDEALEIILPDISDNMGYYLVLDTKNNDFNKEGKQFGGKTYILEGHTTALMLIKKL